MSAPTTLITPEETLLLQRRVALFGQVGFLLGVIAWMIGVALSIYLQTTAFIAAQALHLLGTLVPLAAWLLCRGQKPRSRSFLLRVEAAGTIACAICFYGMVTRWAANTRPDLLAALITTQIIVTRAIFVPSSARRTATISVVAVAPLFYVAYLVREGLDDGSVPLINFMSNSAIWAFTGVALATATSSVIYGLRKQVRQAQELGQYTLLEKLGEGGMGQVFRARHAMLRRPTAVKLLHTSSPEELARFEREVQLTAQLTHPNTVTVFDYGRTPDGVFYYAMELLDGSDLQKLIDAHGPMPAGRVIHILSQVAAALSEAHAVGLIHRDIKPANIILCARGRSSDVAKVVDFGLVRTIERAGATADLVSDEAPVSRGQAAGTPLYMAPETLLDPAGADIRTDLYSLGAVGYFLLTGTPVFTSTSLSAILDAHLRTPPDRPSARLGSSVEPDLEAVLLGCLAKTPAERPRDAVVLLERLRACKEASAWSEEDARSWWSAAAAMKSETKAGEVSWSAKTIAVDLDQRSPRAQTIELPPR